MGFDFTIALRPTGSIACWGNNEYGQCVPPHELGTVTSVAAGYAHSVALGPGGIVRCWGAGRVYTGLSPNYGQSMVPAGLEPVMSIDAGDFHTVALTTAGDVRCWGQNWPDGQCNVPSGMPLSCAVAGGGAHTIALSESGIVRCWGSNYRGQCNVPGDLGLVTAIAAGNDHSVALTSSGSVRCWGSNEFGQSGVPHGIGPVSKIAAGRYNTIALTDTDCDTNGVRDSAELEGHDCNLNSIHDSCDTAFDWLEDCNANGLGDSCEKELSVSLSSGQLGPIGYLANKTWMIASVVRAQSTVTVTLRAHGDFGGLQEHVRVRIGTALDDLALRSSFDCSIGGQAEQSFELAPEAFNTAIGPDGALRVVMEPSIAVDSNGCNGGTWIEASLSYVGARSADCNANGLLDSCEIAAGYSPDSNGNGVVDTCENLVFPCPSDFDRNGTTNGSDLGILLAAWGITGQPGVDLNGDGYVDGADLAMLLVAWGPCET
jgi:hypothetical protein